MSKKHTTQPSIENIKKEAKLLRRKNNKDKPHKHYLNAIAIKHGFKNYDKAKKIIEDRKAKQVRDKRKNVCLTRSYDPDRSYYLITIHNDKHRSYASNLAGWDDDGNELRIIAEVKPDIITDMYRTTKYGNKETEPLLVIHNAIENLLWMNYWKGKALIDCKACSFVTMKSPQLYTQ